MKLMRLKFFRRIKIPAHLGAVLLNSIIAFVGVLAKFSYIVYRGDKGEYVVAKMFGYPYIHQFLWALGNEIFSFSIGIVIWNAAMFVSVYKMKIVFKGVSIFCISSSLYFMGWIFFSNYFGDNTEVTMAIIFSIAGTTLFVSFLYTLSKIVGTINEITEYLTFKIRLLTNCLILVTPDYVRNKDVYFEEIVEPTLEKLNE